MHHKGNNTSIPFVISVAAVMATAWLPTAAVLAAVDATSTVSDAESQGEESASPLNIFYSLMTAPLVLGLPGWQIVLMAVIAARVLANAAGGGGRRVEASHILVKTEERAKALKTELDATVSEGPAAVAALFGELARDNSECPSKAQGGALGSFSAGQMVPEFDKVCWRAPVGVVQGPVATGFGWHLILVTRRDPEPDDKKKMTKEKAK